MAEVHQQPRAGAGAPVPGRGPLQGPDGHVPELREGDPAREPALRLREARAHVPRPGRAEPAGAPANVAIRSSFSNARFLLLFGVLGECGLSMPHVTLKYFDNL